jgi:hypothetical protein
MATTLYFRDEYSNTHRGTNSAKLNSAASGWFCKTLSTTRGPGIAQTGNAATVAGVTPGVELVGFDDTTPIEWISNPVAADVTISGTITANIWALESNMSANVAINVVIDIIRATDNAIVEIVRSTRTTEVAVTTATVNNFTTGMTSGGYTGQTLNKGDRLRIRIFGDDAGTMATGFTFRVIYDSPTAAVNGDTFVTFTETFSFQTTDPVGSGTILEFSNDTATGVTAGSATKLLAYLLGNPAPFGATAVTNTTNGWIAPAQITGTAGGTAVEWYTPQLNAFTLSGWTLWKTGALESSLSANASLAYELAVCDSDGSNAVVWGVGHRAPSSSFPTGELNDSANFQPSYVAADDMAVAAGRRLRLRVFVDDSSTLPTVTGHTVTVNYDGAFDTVDGSGVRLGQTVSEFTPTGEVFGTEEKVLLQSVKTAGLW